MGFKLKHVFKAPTKILHAAGNAGIFGQRGDHFRVLGIKVGKDLVPVVQTAAIVATAAVGGPVLAAETGLSLAASSAIVSTAANATVTGLSGGNEAQVTNAIIVGMTRPVGDVTHTIEQTAVRILLVANKPYK
jgi:hypothetical protein